MPEETPQIDYEAEYKKLTDQLEKANAESARRKSELKELRAETEGLRLQAEEAASLKGELRKIAHKDGIKAIYEDKEVGLNSKVSIDRLMKIMDYQAEGDFDPEAFKSRLAELKETDSYLFANQSEEGSVTPQSPTVQAPAWSGRGVSDVAKKKEVVLTDAHLRDPVFMSQHFASQNKK